MNRLPSRVRLRELGSYRRGYSKRSRFASTTASPRTTPVPQPIDAPELSNIAACGGVGDTHTDQTLAQ